ncbi:hypothetical protein PVAND_010974 [Polypedilum vanderplanki]|uniref:Cuticle protein n=1 Tax=Polypedilum vanderplanki TaxID=319348 RepID=A0A9J6CH63_POLVA|nr:hypothetical protein PVAND_010974 [Polypedilum vanderplanki]
MVKILLYFVLTAVPLVLTARIQLLDISPEEAQKHITQQSLDLSYAKKLSERPAVGKSYNGKIIDSDDYIEEVYDANQFHGQDGLGRAIFGYSDNLMARLEARNVNGEVRGQYRYLDPFGKDVEVQYWSDSLGFHQTDNREQYDLQPVTETPEVRMAREEHERAWKEAARNNGIDVDNGNGYNHGSSDDDDLERQLSSHNLVRFPILPYSKHLSSENADHYGRVDGDAVIVDEDIDREVHSRFARQQEDNGVEEVTSEPRGFFYSFDYPVQFINDRQARNFEQQHEASEAIETIVKNDGSKLAKSESKLTKRNQHQNKANVIEKVRNVPAFEDEVHDVQESPKQKVNRSVKTGRGSIKFKHTI